MRSACRVVLISFLWCIVASPFVLAQAPAHPLEALKSQEYWIVYDVLRDSGKMDVDTFYASVLLHEPPKEKVIAWKLGDPVFREAEVILLRKGIAIEALVDIPGHKLEFWKERKDIQAPVLEMEFHELEQVIKKDSRVIEAMKKRGITDLTHVQCFAGPFGFFALPELEGHRIFYGGCSDTHGEFLGWGRSIEGLNIEIDAVEKKVLKVIDDGPIPVPTASINFEETSSAPREGATPIGLSQPLGPAFKISNGEVNWQSWNFRFRLDPRIGAIINLARFNDGHQLRSVLYEGSLSELFVPYMDPAEGWATRVFIGSM